MRLNLNVSLVSKLKVWAMISVWHMKQTMFLYKKYVLDVEVIPMLYDFANAQGGGGGGFLFGILSLVL